MCWAIPDTWRLLDTNHLQKQECIQVGNVPSAAVAVSGVCLPGGVCLERVSAQGGVCLEGVYTFPL